MAPSSQTPPPPPDFRALHDSLPLTDPDRHALEDPALEARFAAMPAAAPPAPPARLITRNGVVWTLRHTDPDGEGRYAPEAVEHVEDCQRLAMARGSELVAEYGGRAVTS